jgi:TM2 domain-containing membrane protein YozV
MGQTKDSTYIAMPKFKTTIKRELVFPKDPLIALYLSATAPGLGQAYCKKFARGGIIFLANVVSFAIAASANEREVIYKVTDDKSKKPHTLKGKEEISFEKLSGSEKARFLGGFLAGATIYIWNCYDAYQIAKKYNEEIYGPEESIIKVGMNFQNNTPQISLAVNF